MASQISGNAQRTNVYGTRVDRATAALPQSTTATLFTVAGGRVIITTLVAEVTTAIQAQANALQIFSISTTGSVTTNLGASFESNGLALGNLITVPGVPATALSSGSTAVQGNEFITQPGLIRLTAAASNTGALRWTVTYIPLDSGATITAA